jgi:PKD repeat protein
LAADSYLFIYTENDTIGALTNQNNKKFETLMARPIMGEKVKVKLFVPDGIRDNEYSLSIGEIGHLPSKSKTKSVMSDNIDAFLDLISQYGQSKPCQNDINSWMGSSWQREKRAVVEILTKNTDLGYMSCTGWLVNNTKNDKTPYLLTSAHCLADESGAENSLFAFNHEAPLKSDYKGVDQWICGSELLVIPELYNNERFNGDYTLLKLSSDIPEDFHPYFMGLDAKTDEFESFVTISHPMGDLKKIAMCKDTAYYTVYQETIDGMFYTHKWDYSFIEPGSSGGPLLDPNTHLAKAIVFMTPTDPLECGQHDQKMYYSAVCFFFDKVKSYLDPLDSGVKQIQGFDPYPLDTLQGGANLTQSYINEYVTFSVYNADNYNNITWDFGEKANPQTATGEESHRVKFSETGIMSATLTAERKDTGEKETWEVSVEINPDRNLVHEEITSDFTIEEKEPYFTGESIHFKSVSDKWTTEGYSCYWSVNGEKISENSLNMDYEFQNPGIYKISYTVISAHDEDTKEVELTLYEHIKANPVVVAINENSISCSIENSKQGESYYWQLGDGTTSSEQTFEHEYAEMGTYDISLTISNNIEQITKETQHTVSSIPTGIEDELGSLNDELKVYPNPATEFVTISFPTKWKTSTIQIFSTSGKLVYSTNTQESKHTINCDILPKGLNIILMSNGTEKRTNKLLIH